MSNYLGENIPKLGFGFMRLPMNGDKYDLDQTIKMVDEYMAKGFTYFDTAYVYIGGTSEVAIKEAVVERYPRESFQVASKLPLWMAQTHEELQGLFDESLTRAGIEYYDFYLLHAMNEERFAHAEKIGAWDFVKKMKEEGKIKHIGFSFHDSAEVLDKALEKYKDITEFIQLQINYIDWESPSIESRKCYEVALKYDMPIIIMEPVKGGSLVNIPEKASEILKEVQPELSIPSWAIRYCASLKNIVTVLSGMSNQEQLDDNISYMENFQPLNEEEQTALTKAADIINSVPTIPCTNCKYCVEGCPQKINIPEMFKVDNINTVFGKEGQAPINPDGYAWAIKEGGKASECIGCGACEEQCPQHINIIEELQKIVGIYEA